jgi:hypothetical protein
VAIGAGGVRWDTFSLKAAVERPPRNTVIFVSRLRTVFAPRLERGSVGRARIEASTPALVRAAPTPSGSLWRTSWRVHHRPPRVVQCRAHACLVVRETVLLAQPTHGSSGGSASLPSAPSQSGLFFAGPRTVPAARRCRSRTCGRGTDVGSDAQIIGIDPAKQASTPHRTI